MTDMLTASLVRLDADLGSDKEAVIRSLAGIAAEGGRTTQAAILFADALAREATAPTGLPGGIAIPHCRTEAVDVPTLVFARLQPPVEFGAKDGPADIAFLIAAPAGGDATHLQVLTQLARALVRKEFTDGLRSAATPEDVVALVNTAVSTPAATPAPAAAAAPDAVADAAPVAARRSLVAVTACPTGIAHTYMAAEYLETAAAAAGVDIQVETQGSAGSTPLDPSVIAAADAVIFACDVGVRDRHRFAGKPMVNSGVKRAINEPDVMIAEALANADNPNGPRVEGDAAAAGSSDSQMSESKTQVVRRVLMTGVSYMIPFVAAGGLLIALSFLVAGYEIAFKGVEIATKNSLFDLPNLAELELSQVPFDSALLAYIGGVFFALGRAAFGFLVPALAGYIAYGIADRPGIAPGFVMGAIAGTINSGFLGGIVGGVLAGLVARWIASWPVAKWARGLMPVLVIPLFATMISGTIMLVLLAKPLAWLMTNLTEGLNSLQGGSAILLGAILGLMMAFDMGGPLNKVAYGFATAGLAGAAASASDSAPELRIMAAVMLAGMVPPLALALSTVIRPGLYSEVEKENGKAAWLLGASFITEGAIPFAAADPLRVIPPIMLGSGVTGALAMALEVNLRAPHGGIFVLFAVGNIIGFLISLVVGVLVGAAGVLVLKSMRPVEEVVPA